MKKILSVLLAMMLLISAVIPGMVSAQEEEFDIIKVNNIMKETDIFSLKAKSAILMDATTGKILYEYNMNERLPIASITKVMTTLIVMERLKEGKISYEDIITASEYACSYGGSQVYLDPGEKFTLRDMLNAIEIHSANDATVAVAEHVAGSHSAFVHLMNEKAKNLGMTNTKYLDSMGLTDDGQYSTAHDIALLAKELIIKHPEIFEFTTKWYEVFRPGEKRIDLYNRNRLIRFYQGATGLKTGFTTKAGHCLVGTAEREGFKLIAVILGAPDTNTRFAETAKLLDYGFLNFENVVIEEKGIVADTLKVEKGIETKVDVYIKDNSVFLINKHEKDKIERVVNLPEKLVAPVEKDSVAGTVTYLLNGEELGKMDILVSEKVDKAGFFTLLWRMIKSWFGIQ